MQDAHAQYSFMVVPRVFKELTAKRVLTMEWMVGENPTKLLSITKELPSNNTSHYIDERKQLEARVHLLDLVFVGLDLYKLSRSIWPCEVWNDIYQPDFLMLLGITFPCIA
jgi:ABC1 atypical kinase-like domain